MVFPETGKRIVCFDYGLKRIGSAKSDILHITSQPSKTYDIGEIDQLFTDLLEEKPGLVVIGKPPFNEKNGELIKEIEEFAENIKTKIGVEYVFQDESFSSREAVNRMIQSGKKKKFRKEKSNTDMYAAAVILEDYLKNIG